MRMQLTKFRDAFLYMIMILLVVASSIMVYWSISGREALNVTNTPVPVKPHFVKSEDFITLNVDFCKVTNASGRVVQRLVSDKTEIFAPTVYENIPKGCYKNYLVKVPIPPQTAPGEYRITYRVTYKTNPISQVVDSFESERFMVTE